MKLPFPEIIFTINEITISIKIRNFYRNKDDYGQIDSTVYCSRFIKRDENGAIDENFYVHVGKYK